MPNEYADTATAVVYVRIPGWLKNQITRHCQEQEISINAWAANILYRGLQGDIGIPAPPPPAAPKPTPEDVIRGWLTDSPVIEPCGREAPCERETAGTHQLADIEYCNHCGVRVS